MNYKDNSGTLSRNAKKEKDNHPDYKGKATIGGVDYWVAGWAKTGQDGSKFMSLAFTVKDQVKVATERNADRQAEQHERAPIVSTPRREVPRPESTNADNLPF